jgi:hypothetical protein
MAAQIVCPILKFVYCKHKEMCKVKFKENSVKMDNLEKIISEKDKLSNFSMRKMMK